MKSIFEQSGGTYTMQGDYRLPNLSVFGINAFNKCQHINFFYIHGTAHTIVIFVDYRP